MSGFYQWLYYLVPANPLVVRIVQGGSRRVRHLFIRAGYLGALILFLLFGIFSGGVATGSQSLTDLAKAGGVVFQAISYGQVIFICLLAPLFMAGAIAAEQSGQTYNILLTTPLSNLQIVLGSLLGRLFFVLGLLASGLPLFAVLLIFGGVPIGSVFVAFGVAAMSAIMVGSVAITLAVLRVGGRKSVFVFVIAIAAYLVGAYATDIYLLRPLAAAAAAPGANPGLSALAGALIPYGPNSTTVLTPLHPLLVLESSLNAASYRPPSPDAVSAHIWPLRLYLSRPFVSFVLITGLLSSFLVAWSAIRLRVVGTREIGWKRGWIGKLLRLSTGSERRRPARDVWHNPVAWREANTRGNKVANLVGRWGFLLAALLAASLLLYLFDTGTLAGTDFHRALQVLLWMELAVIILVAVYMSAGSVSREREDGTLDLMLTTPITPNYYIWGKLRGLVSFLALLIAAPVLTLTLVSVYTLATGATVTYQLKSGNMTGGTVNAPLALIEAPLLLALMLVPFVALCVIVGMNFSLKSKGVLGAVVWAIASLGGYMIVIGLCGLSSAHNIPLLGPVFNALSPTTNLIMIVNPWETVGEDYFARNEPGGRLNLFIAAGIAAIAYGGIVYAVEVGMVSGFDKTVRKLSGTT